MASGSTYEEHMSYWIPARICVVSSDRLVLCACAIFGDFFVQQECFKLIYVINLW
jgi:hypothetical protein